MIARYYHGNDLWFIKILTRESEDIAYVLIIHYTIQLLWGGGY